MNLTGDKNMESVTRSFDCSNELYQMNTDKCSRIIMSPLY